MNLYKLLGNTWMKIEALLRMDFTLHLYIHGYELKRRRHKETTNG